MENHRLSVGSLAGLAATVPMTAVMAALNRLPPRERLSLPPKRIAHQMAQKIRPLDELEGWPREAYIWASHGLYGAAAGALFGALAPERRRGDTLLGIGFGLAVWAASYPLWLPAAGIDEHPREHSWRRVAEQVASHVVWGAVTAVLTRRWLERSRGSSRVVPNVAGSVRSSRIESPTSS